MSRPIEVVLPGKLVSDEGDPMSRVMVRRLTCCAAILMGSALAGQDGVESAEQPCRVPDQSYGSRNLRDLHEPSGTTDVSFNRVACEPGDIPLAPWDRAPRAGGLCNRWQAHHEEKKAWHYYIRGVGPAVHERSPGRPCLW